MKKIIKLGQIIKNKYRYFLILIILIGTALRVVGLSSNPPAMHADEADTGYTAFSLIQTGMDPYGNPWPPHFENQAKNYRAPLYTYSVIPFVAVLGLNPLAVRLPSALFGLLLILCVYSLLKHLFHKSLIPLVGALSVAVNPWAIHLSRTGLEVMLSAFLTTAGILFFELSRRKKHYLIISAITFSLSLFSYHPAKIFTPLILIILLCFNIRHLLKIKFYTACSFLIFLTAVLILGYLAIFESGARHYDDVRIFDPSRATQVVNQQRTQTTAPLEVSGIFSNKATYLIREFVNMYIGPLSINYLFINGDNNLDKGMGNYGQFHFFSLIPAIIGAYFLWLKKRRLGVFLLLWFLIGLIPAGITNSGNYAYRNVNAMVPLILAISIGWVIGIKSIFETKWRILIVFYGLFALGLFSFFIYNYFFAYPVYSRDWWGYSQKQALEFVRPDNKKYDRVIIQGGMDWAVLYAFYNNISPKKFQSAYKNRIVLNGKYVLRIDNLYIGDTLTDLKNIKGSNIVTSNTLLIVPRDFLKSFDPLSTFRSVDGGIDLKAFEVSDL